MPSFEHVLLLASARSRPLDNAIGGDRDFAALTAADAALALSGCRPIAYAAIRWRVCGDETALPVLRPALGAVLRLAHAPGMFHATFSLIVTLALVAERRHVADELAQAVLTADYDAEHAERHWRRHLRPLYGGATWELERWCGEAFAVARERLIDG